LIFYQVPIENKQLFKWGIKVKTDKKYPDLRLYGVLWVKSIQLSNLLVFFDRKDWKIIIVKRKRFGVKRSLLFAVLVTYHFVLQPNARHNLKFPIFSCRYFICQWCQYSSKSVESFGVSKLSNSRAIHSFESTKGV